MKMCTNLFRDVEVKLDLILNSCVALIREYVDFQVVLIVFADSVNSC